MALAGADGEQAARLLRVAVKQGAATLGTLTEQAVRRYLALPPRQRPKGSLFTNAERKQLGQSLAATNATADLLGRARIRRRLAQAENYHAGIDRLSAGAAGGISGHAGAGHDLPRSRPAGVSHPTAPLGTVSFSEHGTDYACFADNPIAPLSPLRALAWFRRLIPGLFPEQRGEDDAFAASHERQGFNLAATTEETLLAKIHSLIARTLETGRKVKAIPHQIDKLLDNAGVSPRNPQYAEMVFRTNMMSAYNHGSHAEMQEPDVREAFPVWRYVGIRDGRQGKDHEQHFDRYYPNSINFEEVRGDRPYNCRCTSIPIYKKDWQRLQDQGVQLARFAERTSDLVGRDDYRAPDHLLEVPDVPQTDGYSCGAAAAMSVGRYFGMGPEELFEWKKLLGTDPETGTPPEAIVRVLTGLGLKVETRQGMTIAELRTAWRRGSPVICPIQDYGTDVGPRDYDDGHYVTVLGVALGFVFVQDSMADVELADAHTVAAAGRVMVRQQRFLDVWHDQAADGTHYNRFGILVSRPT